MSHYDEILECYIHVPGDVETLAARVAAAKDARIAELEKDNDVLSGEWAVLMADVHDYFKDEKADRGHGRVRLVLTLLGQLRIERDALRTAAEQARVAMERLVNAADMCAQVLNVGAMDDSINCAHTALSALTTALNPEKKP